MKLKSTIELYAGGPGSGCNPKVGKCGRPELTKEQKNAISTHQLSSNFTNNYLRNPDKYPERKETIEQQVKVLDSAIEDAGMTIGNKILYRGVPLGVFGLPNVKRSDSGEFEGVDAKGLNEMIQHLKSFVGKEMTDPGYLSASTDAAVAGAFGDVIMKLTSEDKGLKILPVRNEALGVSMGQKERLLPRGLTVRITDYGYVRVPTSQGVPGGNRLMIVGVIKKRE